MSVNWNYLESRDGFAVKWSAVQLLKKVVPEGRSGVAAATARRAAGGYNDLQAAAAYLRERGYPVVATRRGEDSRWFYSDSKALHRDTAERYLHDAYVAAVRQHRATVGKAGLEEFATAHREHAIRCGEILQFTKPQIEADLRPIPKDTQFTAWLAREGISL